MAQLALGAVAELTRMDAETIDEEISAANAVGPGPDGELVTTPLNMGAVRLGERFASPDDSVLIQRVDNAARQYGLKVAALSIFHPLESALQVTYVVPDDAAINWSIDDLRAAIEGDPRQVEGSLIELDGPDGAPLLESGCAYRTGNGSLWFAAGQDARFGALHGTFYNPPASD
jgi:hypothetical protein